jgi:hypothetical protein
MGESRHRASAKTAEEESQRLKTQQEPALEQNVDSLVFPARFLLPLLHPLKPLAHPSYCVSLLSSPLPPSPLPWPLYLLDPNSRKKIDGDATGRERNGEDQLAVGILD